MTRNIIYGISRSEIHHSSAVFIRLTLGIVFLHTGKIYYRNNNTSFCHNSVYSLTKSKRANQRRDKHRSDSGCTKAKEKKK